MHRHMKAYIASLAGITAAGAIILAAPVATSTDAGAAADKVTALGGFKGMG